jgi:hypothetical protein
MGRDSVAFMASLPNIVDDHQQSESSALPIKLGSKNKERIMTRWSMY